MTQREKKFIGVLVAIIAIVFVFKMVGGPSKKSAARKDSGPRVSTLELKAQADDILLKYADARRGALKSENGFEKFAAEIREAERSNTVTQPTEIKEPPTNIAEKVELQPETRTNSQSGGEPNEQQPGEIEVSKSTPAPPIIDGNQNELLQKIARLESELVESRTRAVEAQSLAETFKAQLTTSSSGDSKLRAALSEKELQVRELQGKADKAQDYQRQSERLKEEIETLKRDNSQLAKLTGEKSELSSAVAALKQSLDSLRSNRKQLEDKVAELESQLKKEQRETKEELKARDERHKQRATRLETELEQKDKELSLLATRIRELEADKKVKLDQKDQLKKLNQELAAKGEDNQKLSKSLKEEKQRADEKEKLLSDMKGELNNKIKEAEECSVKLVASAQLSERLSRLEAEKVALEGELLLAREEVDRLMPRKASATPVQQQIQQQASTSLPSELMRVRVTADVANIRAQAGEEHSALMQVTRGTELMVEDRRGDWFRVGTAGGARGYIRSDFVVELDRNGRPIGRATTAVSKSVAPQSTVPFVSRTDDDSITELKEQLKANRRSAPIEPPPGFVPAPELSNDQKP